MPNGAFSTSASFCLPFFYFWLQRTQKAVLLKPWNVKIRHFESQPSMSFWSSVLLTNKIRNNKKSKNELLHWKFPFRLVKTRSAKSSRQPNTAKATFALINVYNYKFDALLAAVSVRAELSPKIAAKFHKSNGPVGDSCIRRRHGVTNRWNYRNNRKTRLCVRYINYLSGA